MKNIIEISGEKAQITFDPETQLMRGEFIGLNGSADFYADSVHDLIREGHKSLAVFLEMCKEKGITPERRFSGKLNLRLSPQDHEAAVIAASASGKSLNTWITDVIRDATASG